VATNGWREVWDHFKGRGAYPHQLAFLLLNPLRSLLFSPRELVARLHLTANSRVLELGPGPGFFSVHIARRIPSGHLCLVDVQREMLDKARARIRRADVSNVSFAQASASALPFAREVFDTAFLVTVLGEVPDVAACVVQLRDVLRRGGLLSITELAGDPDAMTEAISHGWPKPRISNTQRRSRSASASRSTSEKPAKFYAKRVSPPKTPKASKSPVIYYQTLRGRGLPKTHGHR
jgi:ubiquinone/menaquinone biosynthesis C-methylase UbiE